MKKYLKNLIIFALVIFSVFLANTAQAQTTYINDTTVILDSSVNPKGNPTSAWFEYSTDSNLYSPVQTPRVAIGSVYYDVDFTQTVTNLVPNTVYYYRVVASNRVGTAKGNILSFVTAPNGTVNTYTNNVVFTNPNTYTNTNTNANYVNTNYVNTGTSSITNISATGAILNAVFTNPSRTNASGYFEWGPTKDFGNNTNLVELGTNYTSPFSGELSNLSPNTTYYFRAIVYQGAKTYKGSIQSFQTYASTVSVNNNYQNYQNQYPLVTTNSPAQTINNTPSLAAASVLGTSFLPNNLFGWIIILLILLGIAWVLRKLLK